MTNKTQNDAEAVKKATEVAKAVKATENVEAIKEQTFLKKYQITVNDDCTIVSGKLAHGIKFNGKRHASFQMRLAVVADNLKATQTGWYAKMVEIYANTLLSLGDIPKEKITFDFLINNMTDGAIDVLYAAEAELLKKLEAEESI